MIDSTAILTAQAMRAAELAAVDRGTSLSELMERAGDALARMAWRVASGRPVHVLVGPGNNGGDGYVAARRLAEMGASVAISAGAPPASDLAQAAAARFPGPIGQLPDRPQDNAVLVDCLFGTGLNRRLDPSWSSALAAHAAAAAQTIAADLPSGVDSDCGADLGCPYRADVTLAFGALKPAHLLFPAAAHVGRVELAAIGIGCDSAIRTAVMPVLEPPTHGSHKYRRGLVAIVAGRMGGAAELAARGALRAGAGYVRLIGSSQPPSPPHAIVRQSWRDGEALDDPRIAAIVVGCGLGQGEAAAARLAKALGTGKPLVLDADALAMLGDEALRHPAILTPHAGEFDRLCEGKVGNKIERTLAVARRLRAVLVHKGADTVIAAPDGRVAIASPGTPWLASAGTGDVLAGIAGAMLARGLPAFEAAQAAVLLHQKAARRAGPGLCADDLIMEPIWP